MVSRDELSDANRFAADLAMQTSHDLARVEALLRATVRVLVEMRTLDLDAFEKNLAAASPAKRRVALQLAPPVDDKHAVATPVDLDCAALIPLCGARCCKLAFPLTGEEVAAGRLAWSYREPYLIAHGADDRCVHQDRASGGCTVYADRPAICRSYDCRKDPRIWLDFDQRILAPLTSELESAPDRR